MRRKLLILGTIGAALVASCVGLVAPVSAASNGDGVYVYVSHTTAHKAAADGVRKCATEDDARTCVWDAVHRGNGTGKSFLHIA
jgi:hypothetical protein